MILNNTDHWEGGDPKSNDAIYMVTIIAVIINHNVWIQYTISFSVGTLITQIIRERENKKSTNL